jgi:hypothetical protein
MSNISDFFRYKNERVYIVGGWPGKLKFFLNSMLRIYALDWLFQAGLG